MVALIKKSNNRHALTIIVKQSLRWQVIRFVLKYEKHARPGACAWQRIMLYLKNRGICHLKLCFTIIVEIRPLLNFVFKSEQPFFNKICFYCLMKIFI